MSQWRNLEFTSLEWLRQRKLYEERVEVLENAAKSNHPFLTRLARMKLREIKAPDEPGSY